MTAARAPKALHPMERGPCSPFYEKTLAAARAPGHEQLMRDMNRMHEILAGVGAALRVVVGNSVLDAQHDPDDPNSEPPLTPATEYMITAMAAAVCEHLVDRIEDRAAAYNARVTP